MCLNNSFASVELYAEVFLDASQQDEPVGGIRHVRRIPHPGRGVGSTRARRSNMHFQSAAGSALSGLSPSSRDATMDPIAGTLNTYINSVLIK